MSSCSMRFLTFWICAESCEASLDRMLQLTTGRDTPHALPKATFDGTKTYGTFLTSENLAGDGMCTG